MASPILARWARRAIQRGRHLLDAGLGRCTHTYAQAGEDIIVQFLLSSLGFERPTYLDIGAHQPQRLSNTYLFYLAGGRGVCVEPDPAKIAAFRRDRPRDTCLNAGIGTGSECQAPFYVFDVPGLNTFSKAAAERYVASGHRLVDTLLAPLVSINEVMAEHFSPAPNFVSIDVEGLELAIVRSIDFTRSAPQVFCIETLGYPNKQKNMQLIEVMEGAGYRVFADTMINTVLVRQDCLRQAKGVPWELLQGTRPAACS